MFSKSGPSLLETLSHPYVVENDRKTRDKIDFGRVWARIPHGNYPCRTGSRAFRDNLPAISSFKAG
jgi:hypothetical protein